MKKGITIVTISVILVMAVTGCKKKENNVSDEVSIQSEMPENKSIYTIQDEVYQEGEIELHYPQIKGLTDPAMETKWNEILKTRSLAGVDEWWSKED